MNPAELRRVNRLGSLTASARAAELDPQTDDDLIAAITGAIEDEHPGAIVASAAGAGQALSLNVTIPGEGDFFIFTGRDGQPTAMPVHRSR